jgi:hypothetical protein
VEDDPSVFLDRLFAMSSDRGDGMLLKDCLLATFDSSESTSVWRCNASGSESALPTADVEQSSILPLGVFVELETQLSLPEPQQVYDKLLFDCCNEALVGLRGQMGSARAIESVTEAFLQLRVKETLNAWHSCSHYSPEANDLFTQMLVSEVRAETENARYDGEPENVKMHITDLLLDSLLDEVVSDLDDIFNQRTSL